MTIYDQFDTAPIMAYSGSYGSRVLFGNSSIYSTGSFLRQVIGDAATRTFDTEALVGKKYILSQFPTIYGAAATPNLSRKRFQGFFVASDTSEQFHDSVVGHPISYISANGVTSALLVPDGFAYDDPDGHTVLGVPETPFSSSIYLLIGTSSCQVGMSDGAEEQFCDSVWNYTGPFQSRYKDVFRLKSPTFRTPIAGQSVVSKSLGGGATLRRNKLNITSSYSSVGIIAFTTKSGPSNELPSQMSWLVDGAMSGASVGNLTAEFVSRPGYSVPLMTTPTLYQSFFGFGDGPHGFPKGFYEIAAGGHQYNFAPQIRGWKFGLIDATPRYSQAVYRYGHFGQMRDMLEQRMNTKFYVNNIALSAPVQIRFVSGSEAFTNALDYVSATNPSYDPRDTGFYDYEYRCGHPYVDIEPTD